MSRSVIVGGARTPMGRLLGSLKDFSAADLGGIAIKAALERAGISGDQVDYVIMGQVIQAGADVLVVQLDGLVVVGADGQAWHGSSSSRVLGR